MNDLGCPSPAWSEGVRVRAGEIGPGGRMRLPALFDWLQEAAGNNATALGWGTEALLPRGLTWVLSRLHLRVEALPAWREEATVRTWPSGVHRLWALREFEVTGDSGRILAVGTSGWLLLKLASRRPARPASEIAALGETSPPRTLEDPFEELPGPGGDPEGRREALPRPIGRFDLDLNGHANNVALLRSLLEGASEDLLAPPLALEADFRGEAFEGDLLRAIRSGDGECELLSLSRVGDGREILRARITKG